MESDFEHLYNVMVGLEEPLPFEKQNPLLTRRCELLFETIYAARKRIVRHTSGNMDAESRDVLALVEAYEHMMRLLCKYFYDCGRDAGNDKAEPPFDPQ